MKLLLALLAALAMLLPSGRAEASDRAAVRYIAQGKLVEVYPGLGTQHLRAGGVSVTITAYRCDKGIFSCQDANGFSDRPFVPFVIVQAPGMRRLHFVGQAGSGDQDTIAIGKLDRRQRLPSVMYLNWSMGGLHCCTWARVAHPFGGTWRTFDLGHWDAVVPVEFPRDLSGDGVADFRLADVRFLYAFYGYAGTPAPPMFYTIRHGQLVDISRERAFRRYFLADRARNRAGCAASDGYNNGICAAFAADAAMLGRLDADWPLIVKSYARPKHTIEDWPLPEGCRHWSSDGNCPKEATITYADYPAALRGFLRDTGYVR